MVTKGLIRAPMHRGLSAAQPIGDGRKCVTGGGAWEVRGNGRSQPRLLPCTLRLCYCYSRKGQQRQRPFLFHRKKEEGSATSPDRCKSSYGLNRLHHKSLLGSRAALCFRFGRLFFVLAGFRLRRSRFVRHHESERRDLSQLCRIKDFDERQAIGARSTGR